MEDALTSMAKRRKNPKRPRVGKKAPNQAALVRLWEKAMVAWQRHEYGRCIELLQRARRMSPANPRVHLELGRIHGLTYDYAAAEKSFEKSHRLTTPEARTAMLARAGLLARDFYHPELSERYFARAVEAADAAPEMLVSYAEICERRRLVDKAEALVEQALEMDRQCLPALLLRARLQRRAGRLEDAGNTLRPLVEVASPREVRVRAGYELGTVLDLEGRYDEAMQAFLQAKALLHDEGARHRAKRRQRIRRIRQMREQVTPEVLRRWAEPASERQPAGRLALLGGHPRSGTTLLEQVLDAHDEIVSAEETSHFRDYVVRPVSHGWRDDAPTLETWESASAETLRSARSDYFRVTESCIGGPLGGRLLIDKNPSEIPFAPMLIRTFPEIRFLVALRDPRDVVMSCFMQPMLPLQQVNSTWLRLDTAAEEYAEVMGTWRALAPMIANPWLEVRYEDMVSDLEGVARRTLEFLDVPWDSKVLEFDAHARSKQVRSPAYADVTRKVYTSARGRWRNYQKYLEPHLAKLEPLVKALGYE